MFTIFCKRRLSVTPKDCCIFVAQQQFTSHRNAVLFRSCSTHVCEIASEKTFTLSSYLINSCGLSSNDAVSTSKRLRSFIKSPEKPDAVLKLLREYGFTDAHISRVVIKWPNVLLSCPNKFLLPKLQFFQSIGVPLPVLAQKVSEYPYVLWRSLDKSIIPLYNHLKSLLGSDEIVVHMFTCEPRYEPLLVACANEKLAAHVDRAIAMGFDVSRSGFITAIRVFHNLTESTLRQKMEICRRCGWTESDIDAAFLRYPLCMTLSEKNITATMDFLGNELGCKPAAVAQCPMLLTSSLEKRIKARSLVARVLNDKGLKNMTKIFSLLKMSEVKFLESYIYRYEKDIPEILDIYQGKLSPPEIGHFGRVVKSE